MKRLSIPGHPGGRSEQRTNRALSAENGDNGAPGRRYESRLFRTVPAYNSVARRVLVRSPQVRVTTSTPTVNDTTLHAMLLSRNIFGSPS